MAIDDIRQNPVRYGIADTLDLVRGGVRDLGECAEFVVMDMGPSDEASALAGLVATDELLIPTQTDYTSVTRLVPVLGEVRVARQVKPDLNILGIVPVMTGYYFGRLRQSKRPTSEIIPTWENTPPPVVTVPPPLPQCELKVKGAAINRRAGPSTSAAILGRVAAGQTVAVDRFALAPPYLWAHIPTGWFAVRIRTSIAPEVWEWWVGRGQHARRVSGPARLAGGAGTAAARVQAVRTGRPAHSSRGHTGPRAAVCR